MAYSTDFKQGALDYIKEGHSHVEAAKVFDVGVRTLFTWEKKLREQGHLLDELCIQDKHFFLPLPPYSPDLNPIEQAWAILKKKVTDLLREVPNIFECLECFFIVD